MKRTKRLLAGLLAAMLLAVTVSPTGVLAADTAVITSAQSEAPEPSETPAGCEKAVFDKKPFYHTDGVV